MFWEHVFPYIGNVLILIDELFFRGVYSYTNIHQAYEFDPASRSTVRPHPRAGIASPWGANHSQDAAGAEETVPWLRVMLAVYEDLWLLGNGKNHSEMSNWLRHRMHVLGRWSQWTRCKHKRTHTHTITHKMHQNYSSPWFFWGWFEWFLSSL